MENQKYCYEDVSVYKLYVLDMEKGNPLICDKIDTITVHKAVSRLFPTLDAGYQELYSKYCLELYEEICEELLELEKIGTPLEKISPKYYSATYIYERLTRRSPYILCIKKEEIMSKKKKKIEELEAIRPADLERRPFQILMNEAALEKAFQERSYFINFRLWASAKAREIFNKAGFENRENRENREREKKL